MGHYSVAQVCAIDCIQRVESIKALGVTIIAVKLSIAQHIDNVLGACAHLTRPLTYVRPIRTLRHHGLPDDAIHAVYQAVVVTKLMAYVRLNH